MKALRLIFPFFLISHLVFGASTYAARPNCDEVFSNAGHIASTEEVLLPLEEMGKKTGVKRDLKITEIHTTDSQDFSARDLFKEDSDLIIGIDVRGNTQGHTYLVVGNTRIDGRMFFVPHTKDEADWKLSPGLIIRYPKIPAENMQALVDWIKSDQRFSSPTCVATACKIVYGVGKFENKPGKDYWFPSKLLTHLAEFGLTGADGQRMHPEIYAINRDVRKIWENLPTWKSVPSFIFKVAFDPYTWKGLTDKSFAPKAKP